MIEDIECRDIEVKEASSVIKALNKYLKDNANSAHRKELARISDIRDVMLNIVMSKESGVITFVCPS